MTRIAPNPPLASDPQEFTSRGRNDDHVGLAIARPLGMPPHRSPGVSREESEPARRFSADTLRKFTAQGRAERKQELQALRNDSHTRMSREKLPLAGYLLMRSLDGRSLAREEIVRLDKADDTVIDARKALSSGRGNVHSDIASSNGSTPHLVHSGRGLVEWMWGYVGEEPDRLATAAMYAHAGNCGEHAAVGLVLHAPKLAPGETVHFVAPDVDHKFGEVRTPAGRDHDVVMDPWAHGPAIMAADGRFTDGSVPTRIVKSFTRDELEQMAQETHEQLRILQQGPLVPLKFEEIYNQSSARGRPHPWALYDPIPVLSDAFCARADAQLNAVVWPRRPPGLLNAVVSAVRIMLQGEDLRRMSELRLELEAAGVLRSMGADLRDAATEAAEVVHQARQLMDGAEEVSSCCI